MVIDDARVECDAGPINFKPTVMFQTRMFNFNMKNTGLGAVDYKWAVQHPDGSVDAAGPYTVSMLPLRHMMTCSVYCMLPRSGLPHRSQA